MRPRYFALIPAAGASSRMGQPKLLLPLSGQPLILHTIAAWQRSNIDHIIIVIRPGDEPLAATVRPANVDVVIPDSPPPDMKSSLQAALDHIERRHAPTQSDAFLVAPADMPRLAAPIIDRLIAHHNQSPSLQVLVPTLGRKNGHPVLFPWPFAAEVHSLLPIEGLDSLVRRHQPLSIPCEDLAAANENPFADIDTPQDYKQITTDR